MKQVGAWLVQDRAGLVCADTMRDGESVGEGLVVDGLAGAHAVAVSTDGEHVFVAGYADAAVAVLSWLPGEGADARGRFGYLDRIKKGERMIDRFDDFVNDTATGLFLPVPAEPLPYVEPIGPPHRIGGTTAVGGMNLHVWVFKTRASVAFVTATIGEEGGVITGAVVFSFWNVTAAIGEAGGVVTGAVVLSFWNVTSASWMVIQEVIGRDASPACLSTFSIKDRDGHVWRYIAVGSAPEDGVPVAKPLHVYRWDANAPWDANATSAWLVYHHEVSVALRGGATTSPTSGKPAPTAMAIEALDTFEAGGYTFLFSAASSGSSSPGSAKHARAMSFVWRWNPLGSTALENGAVGQGSGFEVFQLVEECKSASHGGGWRVGFEVFQLVEECKSASHALRGAASDENRMVVTCYAAQTQ
ncbi:hypothetical protein T484DRAFT_1810930, partial [Baffinella frigidus]